MHRLYYQMFLILSSDKAFVKRQNDVSRSVKMLRERRSLFWLQTFRKQKIPLSDESGILIT